MAYPGDDDIAALKQARRIIIVGHCGVGKSTLARKMSRMIVPQFVHLDQLFWLPNWQPRSDQEWISMVEIEVAKEHWIIEGNYASTLHLRLARADVAIWLEAPRWLCLLRVLKRLVANYGRVRADLAPGCPEHFSWDFIKYVWRFRRDYEPRMRAQFDYAPEGLRVIQLNRSRDVKGLLAALSRG